MGRETAAGEGVGVGITISREQWQVMCIERTRMQRVVEAAREVSTGATDEDWSALDNALRDLDALAGQNKATCHRCGGTGVEDDGSHGGIAWPNACPACTSPYSPRGVVGRGRVVLDDDGEV